MSFPNKLAAPAPTGPLSASADELSPSVSERSGDFMGASCCVAPGRDDAADSVKKLTEPLWASEDLATRGGSEWSEADGKRAVSLDATECLGGISLDASLVRSAALEDLTAIDQGRSCENVESDESEANDKHGQRTQSLSDAGFCSGQVEAEDGSTQLNEAQCNSPPTLLDNVAENNTADKGCSNSDFSNNSETVALGNNEARHTSPTRKSMVPVAVTKGLLLGSPSISGYGLVSALQF